MSAEPAYRIRFKVGLFLDHYVIERRKPAGSWEVVTSALSEEEAEQKLTKIAKGPTYYGSQGSRA